jgi:hypothetical protein
MSNHIEIKFIISPLFSLFLTPISSSKLQLLYDFQILTSCFSRLLLKKVRTFPTSTLAIFFTGSSFLQEFILLLKFTRKKNFGLIFVLLWPIDKFSFFTDLLFIVSIFIRNNFCFTFVLL